MEIYGLLGIPEEIIHDQGTQFMSDCLAGGLPTTPCHPMKNGLIINGTFKAMLNGLYAEEPRQ